MAMTSLQEPDAKEEKPAKGADAAAKPAPKEEPAEKSSKPFLDSYGLPSGRGRGT